MKMGDRTILKLVLESMVFKCSRVKVQISPRKPLIISPPPEKGDPHFFFQKPKVPHKYKDFQFQAPQNNGGRVIMELEA